MNKNMSDMFNQLSQFFSPTEMTELMSLQNKSFDEQWDGMAKIITNNTKLPPQAKMMFTDPDISKLLKSTFKKFEEQQLSQEQQIAEMQKVMPQVQAIMIKKLQGGVAPTPKTPAPTPKTPKPPGGSVF